MALKQKPYRGVLNIVYFNWHMYLSALLVVVLLLWASTVFMWYAQLLQLMAALVVLSTITSLLVSFYVYDVSNLYQLPWLTNELKPTDKLLNISAGFDETTPILQSKFPDAQITAADFFNAAQHTEPSIARARNRYPPSNKIVQVTTAQLPFADNYFDNTLIIFAAHEIRNDAERVTFFKELSRVTKHNIYVTEHLRNPVNFLAYNIGFFHFLYRATWLHTFKQAGLRLSKQTPCTIFVTTFTLAKNGFTN